MYIYMISQQPTKQEKLQRERQDEETQNNQGKTYRCITRNEIYQKRYLTIHRANKPQCKKEWL